LDSKVRWTEIMEKKVEVFNAACKAAKSVLTGNTSTDSLDCILNFIQNFDLYHDRFED